MSARAASGLLVLCVAVPLSMGCPGDDGEEPTSTGAESHGTHGSSTGEHDGTGSTTAEHEGTTEGETGHDSSGGTGSETGSAGSSSGGAAPDTWENWAHPEFITPYCADCHPSAQSARDFNDYDTVVANELHIYCGVAPESIGDCASHGIEPGHLPIGDGPKPSTEERWRFVAWMDAGMPRD